MNKFTLIILFILITFCSVAQELNARVTINSSAIGNNVNKVVFQNMQTTITNFLNNRKWSSDNFAPNEKIDCSFLLILQPGGEDDVYSATLTVQSARPVYNTSYVSPIINYQDKDIQFKYIQFQPLEFNENRITSGDALTSNLTAILAYYSYIILAFDYDSYSPRGGDTYFQKAQNIVVNAPQGRGIAGWKAFDGLRNRYWLTENLINSRYAIPHDVYYNYYRQAMDKMYDDVTAARKEMLNVLKLLEQFNADNPNTMANQFFFQGKSNELIKLFSKGTPEEKSAASEILQKLDITNAGRYKDDLK